MITRTEIIYACSRLREDDTGDIPEEWIDYMEKAALEKIESPDLPTKQELIDEAEQMYKMHEAYTSAEKWVTIGLRKGYIEGRKKSIAREKERECEVVRLKDEICKLKKRIADAQDSNSII